MTVETRKQKRREATREAILDGARRALVEQGYEELSMRKLAASVGYSPGALYLYFETKEELFECLVEEAFEKLLEILVEVHEDDDAIGSLKRKMRAYVEFGLGFPNHYHFAFMMSAARKRDQAGDRPHAAFDVLRTAVGRCVAEAPVEWPDVETASQILWTALHGLTSLLIVRPNFPWVERERLIHGVLDTAVGGLQRPARR